MLRIKYRITTLSSILISKGSGDRNLTETFDYLPGRVILGIFAGKFISKNNGVGNKAHENDTFKNLFLKEKIFYSNAYITNDQNKSFIPAPYSIQSEKDNSEVIHDLLFEENNEKNNNGFLQTKYVGGFCNFTINAFSEISVKKSLNFHHARDTDKQSSKKGMIFNYESIDKEQSFEGYIYGDESLLNKLLELCEKKEFIAYTGRSKTSQYGKIKFEFISDPEKCNSEIIIGDNSSDISLTFLSSVIIYDENGNSVCDKIALENYLRGKISNDVKIKRSFIKTSRVDNYVSIWKIKKPSEVSFSAGSCFLLEGVKESDLENLKNLEIYGIGERRNEGYGRITFGIQKVKLYSKLLHKKEDVKQPDSDIPSLTKEYIKQTTENIIEQHTRMKAIIDSKSFYNTNKGKITKSLIGRLESFVKGSSDFEKFKDNINSDVLRKPALDQLENCIMGNDTFYNHLKYNNIKASEILKIANLDSLSNDLLKNVYDPSKDSNLNNDLYKIYYLTFFSFLRKLIKKPVNNQGEQL